MSVDLPLLHSGKVRDVYAVGDDKLLLVASDRLSAYDVILPTPVPDKGAVLTGLSLWWFEQLADVVPNHVVSADMRALGYPSLQGRAVLVDRLDREYGITVSFEQSEWQLARWIHCDDRARFNIPEIGHHVMPTMVMSAVYDRMNRNAILWMAYSTDFIDAQRALQYGLVSHVVPAAQLSEEVERFCQVLLSRPRPAILGLKEYLRVAPRMDEQGAIDYARALHSMVNTSAAMKKPQH